MKKYCGICKTTKWLHNFNFNKNTKDGLQTECRQCKKKRYIINREIAIPVKNLIGEIWKPLTGYEKKYYVSNRGRIKSIARVEIRTDGREFNYFEKLLTPTKNKKSNYLSFMTGLNGKRLYIHRCVAKMFIPNPENKLCVNHKNGIKIDNKVKNLEWCTYSENMYSGYKIGLKMGRRQSTVHSHK